MAKMLRAIFDNTISLLVIVIIFLIILPLPTWLLDILLVTNMAISFVILLITMYIKETLDFSIFPSLLLVTTLFRAGLTVSSTRLILGNGGYAGEVIKTFGEFVVRGNLVVGFIIFLIIVIIQYLVITKGAERVAEVSARFTLDAMPGKQMAIDADLGSQAITEQEAKERRLKITRESEFYGSMDGATKFVKGDAIISIIVAIINSVGGLIIGSFISPVPDPASTFILATIGDGLVSQIPALLISTATGMIVTRAASENSLSKDIVQQFSRVPLALVISGALMILMSFIPGFPVAFLIPFGGGMLVLGVLQLRKQYTEQKALTVPSSDLEEPMMTETEYFSSPENIYDSIDVKPVQVEFGYSLISMIDDKQGSSFTDVIVNFRRNFAEEMGVVIPQILFVDNIRIFPNSYSIKIKGEEVASGEVLPGYYLILDSSGSYSDIDGIDTVEPTFGIPAKWIAPSDVEKSEMLGYSVIEPQSVIVKHLSEVIKKYAYELIGRGELELLLENVKKKNKALVDEVVGGAVSIASFHKIISNLLKERVPVSDMITILETIAEYAPLLNADVDLLTEYCRQALKRTITRLYAHEGKLNVVTLDMAVENAILASLKKTNIGTSFTLEPSVIQTVLTSLNENLQILQSVGADPILVTRPGVRIFFKQFIEQFVPDLIVLSWDEIDNKVETQGFGVVRGT